MYAYTIMKMLTCTIKTQFQEILICELLLIFVEYDHSYYKYLDFPFSLIIKYNFRSIEYILIKYIKKKKNL